MKKPDLTDEILTDCQPRRRQTWIDKLPPELREALLETRRRKHAGDPKYASVNASGLHGYVKRKGYPACANTIRNWLNEKIEG